MKKIIAILFLIINILLFFGIMKVYEDRDLSYIAQIEMEQHGVAPVWLAFSSKKEVDSQAIFELFKELTEQYDLLITIRLGDYDKNQYDFYFASNTNIDQRLGLITGMSVNFNETDDYFYTNRSEDAKGIFFYLLNKDVTVNIYPMTYLHEMPSTVISFVANSQEELDASVAIFMDRFGSYVTWSNVPSSYAFIVQEKINAFLPMTIIMAMICTFLLLMIYVHTKSKKIAIFKSMGTSLFTTACKMFIPLLIVVFLTVMVANALLFVIFVRAVNARTIPMLLDLIRSGLYQLLSAVGVIGLSCALLTFVPTYSLLKNSRLTSHLMHVNYVIKIMMLLTLVPLASGMIDSISQNLALIDYVTNPETRKYQFVPRYEMEYEMDNYNFVEYITEFHRSRDPDIVNSYEILYEYHRAYEILNEAGAIYCRNYTLYGNETGIMVNENYLRKYPIKDIDGNWINIDQIQADVVYFVPTYYFEYLTDEFYLSDMNYNLHYEVVVIDNQQDIFNFNPILDYEYVFRPHMITLYKDTAFRLESSIFWDVFIEADINALLKDTPFHNKIVALTLEENAIRSREWLMNDVMKSLRIVLPVTALIFVVIIQYAYLYLEVYAKRIFVKKLLGHSPFCIFGRLLLESSLVVIIAIMNNICRGFDLGLLLWVMGFDILVYLALVLFSQNIQAKFLSASES